MSDATPSSDDRSLPRLGSYQVLRQLGSGGMSNVFQAIHAESGSLVALKVLPRKLAQNAVLLQRFIREAKSAENLDHPNIVAIYDRGFDQGRHYLVLEFVEGKNLFDRVRADGPMGTAEAVAFTREVALGLDYAAKLGMIHRDIKPANLLISPDGHAKIIDLGLALMTDDEDERVTRDGTTVGTVDYMSPEQARDSRKINELSDIYSLGCTLHYLVTGSPPFPGGNLADKLARHHSAAVPDVRERNPTIPADFAALIQRMMAKKPDQRFAGYDALVAALDQIGKPPATLAAPAFADVLIDDEDDEDDFVELTIAAAPDGPARPPAAQRRDAPGAPGPGPAVPPAISLADLAALDDDQPSASARRRGLKAPGPNSPQSSVVIDALLEDSPEEGGSATIRRASDELPLQTWIVAGVGVGVLIAVVAFGVHFALSLLRSPEETPIVAGDRDPATAGATEAPTSNETGTYAASPVASSPAKPNRKPPELVGPPALAIARPARPVRPLAEVAFDDGLMRRLGFAPTDPAPQVVPASKVVVRRLAESGDPAQTSSLAAAFGRANDEVEIADIGPFFEDDFQIAGKARLIRGRAGLRPILKVEATRQALVREQEAKFLLGLNGVEQLTLEGLDIVVDVRDLPPAQSALFLCQGADLTLRDCSITIANADDRKNGFAVFRLGNGPRPNRLRLDRCLIRGPVQTLAHLVASKADLSVDRSVVVGAGGPLVQLDPADKPDRHVQFLRSLLVTRGPALAWTGKPAATVVRSLGTTFAHVDPATPSPMWVGRGAVPGEARSWLDYDGEANRYLGWTTLAQWGPAAAQSTSIRLGIQGDWSGADAASQESLASWPASSTAEAATAATFEDLLPEASATLGGVARPHPNMLELTVDLFNRLPAPDLRTDFSSQPPSTPPRATVNLAFETQTGQRADLGLFLAAKVVDPAKHYLVRVQGTANQVMTPVRLPDGASVAIVGPGGDGPGNPIPVFFAAAPGRALIELHGGDLALANLGFASDGANRTRHWIEVEDGLLAVRRCRYRDLAPADEAPGAAAIAFVARANQPIPPRVGGFGAATTRPIASLDDCWIWTLSDGIAAEVARGIVELENCLILAGPAAFRLKPAAAQPRDQEADLVLENCTVVDDRFGVQLDPAPGGAAEDGRPWLVVSRSSVFPRTGREGGALLGVDPATFARGGLFWQSSNDLYEVGRFLGPAGGPGASGAGSADLKRHWIDLWGLDHTRGDRGPDARKLDRVLHFRDKDRARTSRPTPPQLELDPKQHAAGQGVNFKSLPPIPKS